jgi:hypothetical protein
MSVIQKVNNGSVSSSERRKKRRFLTPEKKFQIFLESQSSKTPVGTKIYFYKVFCIR